MAFAQDAPPPTGAPPAAAPATAAPTAPPEQGGGDDDKYEGRLRIGFNINGGYGTSSGISGPMFGGTFRVGWQIDSLMAIYANLSPFVWAGSSSVTAPGISAASIGAIAGVQTSPMFSLTPADIVEIAAGPSADYYTGGGVSAGPGGSSVGGFSDMYFGIHGRVALHLGGRNAAGRRRGFTLGGDVHPTFASGSAITFFSLGLGADWY
jgi:hypothetical protein